MTKYLSKPKVGERYGKTSRTIDNWVSRRELGFPKPVIINGREHFLVDGEDGLDAWDRRLAAASLSKTEAA